jgi:integrase
MATIRQKGPGQWHVQIRRKGWPSVTETFRTERDAKAFANDVESQMDKRLFVDRSASDRVTFGQAIERYIQDVTKSRRSEESAEPEEARLRRFLRDERGLCEHALSRLTPEQFEAWRDRRLTETVRRGSPYKPEPPAPKGRTRQDGSPRKNAAKPKAPPMPPKTISPGTVKREMALLKRVLDYAVKTYKLVANPLGDKNLVARPSVQDERDVRLTEEQWERLLAECRKSRNPWLSPYVELAVQIGARRKNLHSLLWVDVDIATATVILRDVKNSRKPDEVRTVEVGLTPRAIEILEALPRSMDGRVFPTSRQSITLAFKRARARAGVPFFRIHDSRHELASRLVEAGWEIVDVMAQGDWRDPKSLKRYYNAQGKHLGSKLAHVPSGQKRQP